MRKYGVNYRFCWRGVCDFSRALLFFCSHFGLIRFLYARTTVYPGALSATTNKPESTDGSVPFSNRNRSFRTANKHVDEWRTRTAAGRVVKPKTKYENRTKSPAPYISRLIIEIFPRRGLFPMFISLFAHQAARTQRSVRNIYDVGPGPKILSAEKTTVNTHKKKTTVVFA